MYPDLWQGIGEVFTRHGDITALTEGDIPRANNEALARVYRLAAEYDLPVVLHSNITSKREQTRNGSRHSNFRCESAGFVKDSGTVRASEKATGEKNHGNREGIK
ncbi:MAG: hypothetical protein R6U98_23570 [Pirellulaceae bacterium]